MWCLISNKDINMSKTQIIKAANITAHDSALSAIEMLITSHKEYKIIAEQERTKRQAIQAWKETRLAQIQSQKEILQNYLEYTFADGTRRTYEQNILILKKDATRDA